MGKMVYRGCVAVREWGERKKLGAASSLGKLATAFVSCIARAGGSKSR